MRNAAVIGNIWIQSRIGFFGQIAYWLTGERECIGIDMGDGNIVHVDMSGRHFTKYRRWKGEITILTLSTPLTNGQRELLRIHAIVEPVWGYDFFNAIRRLFWKSKNDVKSTGKFFHGAEFVSSMYRSVDVDLFPGLSDDSVQPQDFLVSSFLTRV